MLKIYSGIALALALLAPRGAAAQTAVTADRIYLGATGCRLSTAAAAPSGGASCDWWIDTSTGHVWTNHGGTWIDVSTRTPTFQTVTASASVTAPLLSTSRIETAAGNLTIAPVGDLLLAPAGRDVLPGSNYAVSLGALGAKYLTLHAAELWVETLVAQKEIATIGGRVLVAPTNILSADLAAGANVLVVKYNNFQVGEIVYLEAAGRVEFMSIVAGPGGSDGVYQYQVTRNLDGSGADAWTAGDALIDTGTVGKGFLDLYSLSGVLTGAGPAMVGNVRTGPGYNEIAPRFAVGNLDGLYGHGANQYGFAAGNPLGAYVYLDDSNGLVMGGPGGVRVQITPAGLATFIGDGGGVTNINGGSIATDSITANQIAAGAVTASELAAGSVTAGKVAAHSITVNELNATGYGDNVIKNGSFEPSPGEQFGASVAALAGWVKSADVTNDTPLQNQPGGLLGPGTLLEIASTGTYNGATYLAVPVERSSGISVGVKYRISGRVYSAGGPILYLIIAESNQSAAGVRRVIRSGGTVTAPDILQSSETIVAACAPMTNGWQTFEYVYTPKDDTQWVSLGLYNGSGICAGAGYTPMYFDDIEMQKQIGTGHIQANSITANLIQAGAITADKIAAGAITADKIAAGAITAGSLAADSITAREIGSGAVQADELAAGAVTAGKIAAGSITADRMNVSALSAITANLGAVNAGSLTAVAITGGTIDGTTIRGVNISASSAITGASISSSTMTAGAVTLDGNGMTVAGGDGGGSARLKLGSVQLWGSNGGALLVSDGGFDIQAIRAHQNVDFEKLLHVYQNVTVDGQISAGASILTSVNMGFQGGGTPTLYWLGGGLPPLANGGTQAYVDTSCNCLARLASSARYKENFRAFRPADPLAVLSLPLVLFDMRAIPGVIPSKDHLGFTAEDLERLAPLAVVRDADGRPDSYNSQALETYLLAALKAVNARVAGTEALERRIAELERKLAALEKAKGKQ